MAGKIHELIHELIRLRTARGSGTTHFVRANLVLNGIDPSQFDETSADDPEVIARLESMIAEYKRR